MNLMLYSILTHCGHKATRNWVNVGSGNGLVPSCSGNGLLPDGTKLITWTNVDLSSVRSCGIHRRALSWEDLKIPVSKTRVKITFLESHSDLPGANELSTVSYLSIWVLISLCEAPWDVFSFVVDFPIGWIIDLMLTGLFAASLPGPSRYRNSCYIEVSQLWYCLEFIMGIPIQEIQAACFMIIILGWYSVHELCVIWRKSKLSDRNL